MYASPTYLDQIRAADKLGPKGWGSLHRTYALAVLVIGGIASYQLRDVNLAVAAAILASTWALIFQLIATTKLINKSLMMINAEQERQASASRAPATARTPVMVQ
jgi:hypothetical protein